MLAPPPPARASAFLPLVLGLFSPYLLFDPEKRGG
jgi:hypothetical protein